MPQPPQTPAERITIRSSLNLLYVVCTVHARCVQPFLRAYIGARAQGFYSLAAGVLMSYAACLAEDQLFIYYVGAWVVAIMAQRMDSAKYRNQTHSQFTGSPRLAELLCPFVKNDGTLRLVIEPLLCFGAGFLLSHWSMDVGRLVGMAGVSLMLIERLDRRIRDSRIQAVLDARLESEYLASGVRDRF